MTASTPPHAPEPAATAAVGCHVDIDRLTDITTRVEAAATLLSFALASTGIEARLPKPGRAAVPDIPASALWSWEVTRACRNRLNEISAAIHSLSAASGAFSPTRPAASAIGWLLPLTSAGRHLGVLMERDREKGVRELITQLGVVDRELEATQKLIVTVSNALAPDHRDGGTDGAGFAGARDALLERAGGSLSLTEAAAAMGISRQALHRRIRTGSALGMMRDDEIVIPVVQFVDGSGTAAGKKVVRPGIAPVVKLFETSGAGPWSALQFLIDTDPNLGRPPVEALATGDPSAVRAVEHAARAYLGEENGGEEGG
ncbi:hypothetical protein [Azospirillum halopraeferens]|uniref:hypothetical protein n=1 Tax=Azospirillum halopraeferens TaxID=34010 RepID=UPI000422613A|nr:hypothetical protein [Azospirillum halopraeferens]